ncbi:MAG TPA: toll/interleukin-1 receptor domain-containing protein [Accumulibacter sp.]|nr:toll/interleukin-1 receptor domain-containing protein [Accumulibacter sp.]
MPFKDFFISHSHHDEDDVKRLVARMHAAQLDVYVDVDDPLLAGEADAELAARLRDRLLECRALLVVASAKSTTSGWIPWELGFAHGVVGRVCVLALDEKARAAHAQREYFHLYEWITPAEVESRLLQAALQAKAEAITPAMLEQLYLQARIVMEQAQRALIDPKAAVNLYSVGPIRGTDAFGRGLTQGASESQNSTLE